MAIEEDGKWAVGAMWMLCLLVLFFVVLRIYTRVVLVHSFGYDDVAYMIAFVFLILVSAVMTASAYYGFGQANTPNNQATANAMLLEAIGINIVGTGMIIAKLSLGLFLLRIVEVRWHKFAIWGVMGLLVLASLSTIVVYWTQCQPVAFMWDKRIKGGKCTNRFVPAAYVVASVCVFADFFFVIFPWVIMWKLNINRRDKTLILSSLSLGAIAGACGIKRTSEIGALYEPDFLKASLPVAVWSIAEMAVTMMCTGVPVCLPYFLRLYGKWSSKNRTNSSGNIESGQVQYNNGNSGQTPNSYTSTLSGMARKLGIAMTMFETQVEDRRSDDEITLHDYRNTRNNTEESLQIEGIRVREECEVVVEERISRSGEPV